ncbi:MAG: hypothetical protein ACKKMV_02545 [Candidatus Nealsonbacteria bacterium]|nr:MAG: hypothetical protein IB617_03005 [Candidatus Nealsonbacteria bacterium]
MTRLIKKTFKLFKKVVKRLFGLVELFLFLRLLLKFLNANPKTIVISFIYKYSDVLISPFNFIFSDIYWNGKLIETATISAMIGYAIFVFVFLRLLHLFSRD